MLFKQTLWTKYMFILLWLTFEIQTSYDFPGYCVQVWHHDKQPILNGCYQYHRCYFVIITGFSSWFITVYSVTAVYFIIKSGIQLKMKMLSFQYVISHCGWEIIRSSYFHNGISHVLNTLRPRQDDRHFAYVCKCIFFIENVWISI